MSLDEKNNGYQVNERFYDAAPDQLLSELEVITTLAAEQPFLRQEEKKKLDLNNHSSGPIEDVERNEDLRICAMCHKPHYTKNCDRTQSTNTASVPKGTHILPHQEAIADLSLQSHHRE